MKWVYHDGGRSLAGYAKPTNDCVYRAVAIVTNQDYGIVKFQIDALITNAEKLSRQRRTNYRRSSTHNGVSKTTTRKILETLGFTWTPCMSIVSGCRVHLCDGELPMGRLIVAVTHHVVAVIDGVIYDTCDPSREGSRCVYGYFTQREKL